MRRSTNSATAATGHQPDLTPCEVYRSELSGAGHLTLQQLSNLLLSIRDNVDLDKAERLRLLEIVDALVWERSQENG